MFIFCRSKRNHDSHGYILEFGTIANSLFLTSARARPGRRPETEEGQRLLLERKAKEKVWKRA
jgi:hypothetical protein